MAYSEHRSEALLSALLSAMALWGCSGDSASGRENGSNTGGRSSIVDVPPSVLLASCGNGRLDPGEHCDDGNKTNLEGCNEVCQLEADWECPTPGKACIFSAECGDGKLALQEVCDDKNAVGGDGCSSDCRLVEPGFQCRAPGKHCVPLCGDGVLKGSEQCDDLNTTPLDGCSSTCLVEPGWSCDAATCVKAICGNGVVETGESCDAGPANGLFFGNATGCSKTCTPEPSCRDAQGSNVACATACGDGNMDAGEVCDDGNQVSGDGCSATCQAEMGFNCTAMDTPDTSPCTAAPGQQCLVLPITFRDFDGQHLPSGHPDFFFLGGNTRCVPNASGVPALRDNGDDPATACYSSDATALCRDLVRPTLSSTGKPELNATRTGGTACGCRFTDWDGTGLLAGLPGVQTCYDAGGNARPWIETSVPVIHSPESFVQWYSDSALSTKIVQTLELIPIASLNQYQFSSSNGRTVYDDIHDIYMQTGVVTSLSSGFFPLEAEARPKVCNLWPYWWPQLATICQANVDMPDTMPVWSQWDPRGSYSTNPPIEGMGGPVWPVTGVPRNFYFSSEVRYLFRYAGGEMLSFFGDDDVWVFINGRLVLDLGAPHQRLQGGVTLTPTGANWTISSQTLEGLPIPIDQGVVQGLGLEVGKTYEIAVFHADRHPRESNYQLTLSGFGTRRSFCQPTCGDGVAAAAEECDDGAMNQDGVYGGCTTQCKFGPFCGDGAVDAAGGETCDAGLKNGVDAGYGSSGCSAGCQLPPRCGDGVIDTQHGEQCDAAASNGGGNLCSATCQLIPR